MIPSGFLCRVPCVCYDLVSCVCYDSVRMYVIMYDMIRYVRNTIRSRMTDLCALCGTITYEYVYDMALTRTNMRYVALCYVYDSCGIPRLPYVYVYDSVPGGRTPVGFRSDPRS